MILAQHVVRTTGINWQSLGAIAALLAVAVGLLTWWITRRDNKRQHQQDLREREADSRNEAIKQEISTAVERLGERLEMQLATKDAVSSISERLARLEGAAGTVHSGA